jgi:hypothetical protein
MSSHNGAAVRAAPGDSPPVHASGEPVSAIWHCIRDQQRKVASALKFIIFMCLIMTTLSPAGA